MPCTVDIGAGHIFLEVRRLKMVYIASPLRGDYNTNIKNAVEYCRLAGEKGVLPLAPHIIFSQWCNDIIPEQREQGLRLGLALLQKADELWVMGTTFSQGMQGEVKFAQEHGIPMFFVTHPHDLNYYPVSADENRLLSKLDCVPESSRENYKDQLVVLRHEQNCYQGTEYGGQSKGNGFSRLSETPADEGENRQGSLPAVRGRLRGYRPKNFNFRCRGSSTACRSLYAF